jgi:glycosyl transferase family 25
MRILLINLARATERRQKMEARFDELGLAFELLDATDGRALTTAERALADNERRRWITPHPLSDNEIGCCISHCRAMGRLVESGERMAAIVEDDATLAPDFPRVLAAIETLDTPFDVIDLHRTFKKGEMFLSCRPLLPGFSLGRIGYAHINATAYVMSSAGARKFLARVPPFVHMVDKEMHRPWANGLDVYGLERPVAFHTDEGRSYIDESRLHGDTTRPRYADADSLQWKLARTLTRISESIRKRVSYAAYKRKGKAVA